MVIMVMMMVKVMMATVMMAMVMMATVTTPTAVMVMAMEAVECAGCAEHGPKPATRRRDGQDISATTSWLLFFLPRQPEQRPRAGPGAAGPVLPPLDMMAQTIQAVARCREADLVARRPLERHCGPLLLVNWRNRDN